LALLGGCLIYACGSFSWPHVCSILHTPRPAERYPNFSILNSLFAIPAFYPPLPPRQQSKRTSTEVEVQVEFRRQL